MDKKDANNMANVNTPGYVRTEVTQVPRVSGGAEAIAALRAGDEPGLRLAVRVDVTQGLRMLVG